MEQLSEEYPVEKRSVCVVVFSSPDKMVVTAAGSSRIHSASTVKTTNSSYNVMI